MKKITLLGIFFLFLITGCKKNEIIGTWESIDNDNKYYYIFNDDSTCSYKLSNARLDCTYETNSDELTITYKGDTKENKYKYHIENDTLIINVDNTDYKFSKVSE